VFRGAWDAARTTAVAFEALVAVPEAFDAVTRTRNRRPTSADATTYVVEVAPPIAAQSDPVGLPPELGQRTHWYAKEVGLLAQVPWLAVSLDPTTALPETTGSATLAGTEPMSSVGFEAAVAVSPPFVAVTRTRRREPTSPFATTYAAVDAPPITAQSDPSLLPPEAGQRTHWYATGWSGLGLHVPDVVVSVEPTNAVPEIVGSAVFTGVVAVAATPMPDVTTTESVTTATAKPAADSPRRRRLGDLRLSSCDMSHSSVGFGGDVAETGADTSRVSAEPVRGARGRANAV
jgi:hypothetical protein